MRKIVPILCILALSLSGCRATTLLRNGVDELRDYIASENAKTKKKLNDQRNEKISTLNRAISEKNEEIIFELMADDLREDGDKLKSQLRMPQITLSKERSGLMTMKAIIIVAFGYTGYLILQ